MMTAVFATLFLAFGLDLAGRQRCAVVALFVSLALGVGLFLWEIHSPEYGFRMPWLEVRMMPPFNPLSGRVVS